MYTCTTTIRLSHTDAGGGIFYGSLFNLAHEAYEAFLEPEFYCTKDSFICPIVHTEADYHEPMQVSDRMTIELQLDKLGNTSFHLKYLFRHDTGELAATVKTVHVLLSGNGKGPMSIPDNLKQKLLSALPDASVDLKE